MWAMRSLLLLVKVLVLVSAKEKALVCGYTLCFFHIVKNRTFLTTVYNIVPEKRHKQLTT